jgi:hypothetical protein
VPTLFEDEEVVLYLLRRRRAHAGAVEHAIADASFVRCRLLGPIHLRLDDDVLVRGCRFEPSAAACVEAADPARPYVGSFRVAGCVFEDCVFDDVKLVVAPSHPLAAPGQVFAEVV